jgi:hypothetical protein
LWSLESGSKLNQNLLVIRENCWLRSRVRQRSIPHQNFWLSEENCQLRVLCERRPPHQNFWLRNENCRLRVLCGKEICCDV